MRLLGVGHSATDDWEAGTVLATAKDEIRKLLDALPDDATWEDVQYSIYVRERVERAPREAQQGNLVDQDEVETRIKQWLTK